MAPNHETFLLSAATDDERQDWIKAIRKVMFAQKGGGTVDNTFSTHISLAFLSYKEGYSDI